MALTERQRIRRARIAAHASWAKTADRKERTAPATSAFLARFEKQVDPLGVLEPHVRAEMAAHARKAYMLRLAERSATARARRGPRSGVRREPSDSETGRLGGMASP